MAWSLAIHHIDVGQGESTVVIVRDIPVSNNNTSSTGTIKKVVVIDGGNEGNGIKVADFLMKLGVKNIDIVVASHFDNDHIGGLCFLLESTALCIKTKIYDRGEPGEIGKFMLYSDVASGKKTPPYRDKAQGATKLLGAIQKRQDAVANLAQLNQKDEVLIVNELLNALQTKPDSFVSKAQDHQKRIGGDAETLNSELTITRQNLEKALNTLRLLQDERQSATYADLQVQRQIKSLLEQWRSDYKDKLADPLSKVNTTKLATAMGRLPTLENLKNACLEMKKVVPDDLYTPNANIIAALNEKKNKQMADRSIPNAEGIVKGLYDRLLPQETEIERLRHLKYSLEQIALLDISNTKTEFQMGEFRKQIEIIIKREIFIKRVTQDIAIRVEGSAAIPSGWKLPFWLLHKELLDLGVDAPKMTCVAANMFVATNPVGNEGKNNVEVNECTTLDNATSLAFIISFKGFTYFTGGDIESPQEWSIAQYLKKHHAPGHLCAFKASHHGADESTSAKFLEETRPTIAVVSCGPPGTQAFKYNHPSPNMIGRLNNSAVQRYYLTSCMHEREGIPQSSGEKQFQSKAKGRVLGGTPQDSTEENPKPEIAGDISLTTLGGHAFTLSYFESDRSKLLVKRSLKCGQDAELTDDEEPEKEEMLIDDDKTSKRPVPVDSGEEKEEMPEDDEKDLSGSPTKKPKQDQTGEGKQK